MIRRIECKIDERESNQNNNNYKKRHRDEELIPIHVEFFFFLFHWIGFIFKWIEKCGRRCSVRTEELCEKFWMCLQLFVYLILSLSHTCAFRCVKNSNIVKKKKRRKAMALYIDHGLQQNTKKKKRKEKIGTKTNIFQFPNTNIHSSL